MRSRFEALEGITEVSIDIGPHYKKPGKKRAKKSYAKCVAINSNVDADQRKETNGQSMRDSRRETRIPSKTLATKQSSQVERKKRQAKLHQ